MEQRPLRLGDIVDDYCPRERRITNHAIVAIVNVEIRQTRCTTCEAEHVYKAAKVPRRRPSQADDGEQPGQLVLPRPADASPPAPMRADDASEEVTLTADIPTIEENPPEPASDPAVEGQPSDEVWHTHRRLIRATLPRTEGDAPPPRPIPEFTMHQRPVRHGRGRWHGNGNGSANGNPTGNGFGPGRPGRNGPPGPGGGGGRPRRHRGKRSR